jgi:hypothetical protein
MALLVGTIAPPGDRTMAPPRVVAAGVAAFFGFAAAFAAVAGLAAGFFLPLTPRVASKLRTLRAAPW